MLFHIYSESASAYFCKYLLQFLPILQIIQPSQLSPSEVFALPFVDTINGIIANLSPSSSSTELALSSSYTATRKLAVIVVNWLESAHLLFSIFRSAPEDLISTLKI
jgi:hypothetical protein